MKEVESWSTGPVRVDSDGVPDLISSRVGASRSASMVLAYLINRNGWDYETAESYLKLRHKQTNPNSNFKHQLREYAANNGKRSVCPGATCSSQERRSG